MPLLTLLSIKSKSATSAVLAFLLANFSRAQDKSVDVEQAIKTIERFERELTRIRFQSVSYNGKAPDLADIENLKFNAPEFRSFDSVVFEPGTGRIRREMRATTRWIDGPEGENFASLDCALTFDGKEQRELVIQVPGKKPPKRGVTAGQGEVTDAKDYDSPNRQSFINHWMQPLRHFPFVYGNRLSVIMAKAKQAGSLSVFELADGCWRLRVPSPTLDKGEELEIAYDPASGRVLGTKWFVTADGKKQAWKQVVIKWGKSDKGRWMPERIDEVNLQVRAIARQEISEVTINSPIEGEVFQLDFPEKTSVFDRIFDKRYVVGPPVQMKRPASPTK